VKRKRRRQELDKVQATRGKKKIRVDEYAGWERTSVVGIVSCNKKLVGLKRKVCRLGMKLYEASIEKFFPNVCLLLRFSLCCYFHFSHRRYTLVCINKRISSLNEIRQTEKGFHLEGSKGKVTVRHQTHTLVRCMEQKKREGIAGVSACARFGKQWPNFISANWSSSGNLCRMSCLRQAFIYSPFIVQYQIFC